MKKLLALGAIVALTTSLTFAAGFGDAFKDAANAAKADLKSAVQADINNAKKANADAASAKKAEKIAEINKKLSALESQLKSVKADKSITETERALKVRSIERQIEYFNKQKAALK